MIIKTCELEGRPLDYAVAVATGEAPDYTDDGHVHCEQYSTDWSQGGPLIAECITCLVDDESYCYADTWAKAKCYGKPLTEYDGKGSTLLVAACRAIVTSELGEEVDVPDEIAKSGG